MCKVYRLDRRELLILLHANCELELQYTVMLTDCGVPVPVHEIQYVELMIVLYFLSYSSCD
jgi:hypothetical protein